MKALRLFCLAGVVASLAGCGTVMRGFSQDVALETAPPGATLALSTGQSCVSPCTVTVDRVASVTIRASKPGCQDALRELPSSFPEGGTALFSVIDFQTGGAAEHQPNPVTIGLTCNGQGPTVLIPYDDRTLALLNGDQGQGAAPSPFDESVAPQQPSRLLPKTPLQP